MQNVRELERLVVVETKLDQLFDQQRQLIEQQKSTNAKLDLLLPTLVTQTQLQERLSTLASEQNEIRQAIAEAKRKTALQTWVTGALSAAFGVVMTILIQAYLSH